MSCPVSRLSGLKASSAARLLRSGSLFLVFALAPFFVAPMARALDPPPDGGYPGGNTAEGEDALSSNATGRYNTAIGVNVLVRNITGSNNTATGAAALGLNVASNNTATGYSALVSNGTGTRNTATGVNALSSTSVANDNTANGYNALNHSTGSNNTALGSKAGSNLTTGSDNIDIAAPGEAGESAKIRIGKQGIQSGTFIAGIHGVTVAAGVGVIINPHGQLGTVISSARFKESIKPMDKASEAILSLQPVTFRYKQELDPDAIPQFGLIAEEVEKVDPNLVVRGEDGKLMTVRYEAVNAMLLNEFLKEHRNVAEQQSTIAELKATLTQQQEEFCAKIAQQQKQIEALTATVQKVSDQIALVKPAPELVVNP